MALVLLSGCTSWQVGSTGQPPSAPVTNPSVAFSEGWEDQISLARARLLKVALEQSDRPSADWDPGQRDCAGFVRYLYRSAVTRKAEMWRTHQTEAAPFASAGELVAYNFSEVTRSPDTSHLRTGDLLVFHRPQVARVEDAWHLMIVLKSPAGSNRDLVVYHNGASGEQGQVRKVWLDELLNAPMTEWRPEPRNQNFVGVYRWNGWKK